MKFPTRRASVAIALLEHPNGISGREIDFKYFLNCGRNEVNHFIHEGVNILKSDEKGNRGGYFTIYQIANRQNALKVVRIINTERKRCKLPPLTESEIYHYWKHFEG